MISDNKLVEYIYDHMEEIQWYENAMGGFIGTFNKVDIYINGSSYSRITLTFVTGHEHYVIIEPQILELAPAGRIIKFFKTKVFNMEHELDIQTKSDIHIRETLQKILDHATNQCLERYSDPNFSKKLRTRIWNKLTDGADLF